MDFRRADRIPARSPAPRAAVRDHRAERAAAPLGVAGLVGHPRPVLGGWVRRAPALRGRGCGPWPSGPAPRGGQWAVRRRAAKPRPAAARAISTPPEKLLDQYIAW